MFSSSGKILTTSYSMLDLFWVLIASICFFICSSIVSNLFSFKVKLSLKRFFASGPKGTVVEHTSIAIVSLGRALTLFTILSVIAFFISLPVLAALTKSVLADLK